MLHLFLHQITSKTSSFDHLLGELPLVIQNRIVKKKQQKKRESSLLGYLLLQRALIQYFDTNLEAITFLSSGKPVLKLANRSLSFNISHSQNLVGVVIGEGGALGLDIEAFRKFDSVESSFSFFSPIEQEAILEAPDSDWKMIEFWSKKEALVKAVGGKMFDMAAYTDVRFETISWKGNIYQLSPIDYDFEGFIWVASSLSINNISIKKVKRLFKI
jgi:phosphopantetheinyl transferase